MSGEDPHKLMERWEKEGKMDEWKRLEEAYNRLTSEPENPFFLPAETLRQIFQNEKEKQCIQKWWQCMQRNFTLPGFPPGGGSPAGAMIAGGKAGETFLKGVAWEQARRHALKTGRWMFWRFKVYKRWMWLSKLSGGVSLYLGIAIPYTGCLIELVDCYLDIIPSGSFSEQLLDLFIK